MQAKIPLILIITYQQEDSIPRDLRALLSAATKIQLSPFTEAETAEYVAETLHRDQEYILPLVAIVQEKSRGNVFYIREILDTCYRKHCVYYCWKEGQWVFSIDKIFEQLESPEYGSSINTDFISKRLQELPTTARKLLAWASLLGGHFSFTLVKKLLDPRNAPSDATRVPLLLERECPVTALNAAITAFVLMPGDDEDRFRFSHDRYLSAAVTTLDAEWDVPIMHYMIAQSAITNEE